MAACRVVASWRALATRRSSTYAPRAALAGVPEPGQTVLASFGGEPFPGLASSAGEAARARRSGDAMAVAHGAAGGLAPLPSPVTTTPAGVGVGSPLVDVPHAWQPVVDLGVPGWGLDGEAAEGMWADSVLRKRKKKMNKHKYRKWRKKMRNRGGQNQKQD